MKFFVLLVFITLGKSSLSQVWKGTFFIVAVCKDGIVIGVDSRVSFTMNRQDSVYKIPEAYFDPIQKVFAIRDFAMVMAGKASFNGRSIESQIKSFDSTIVNEDSLLQIVNLWHRFALKVDDNMLQQKVVFAKYENGNPTLIIPEATRYIKTIDKENFITYDTSDFENHYKNRYSCKKMAKIIKRDIYAYAIKMNKKEIIGGPISLLKISPDNKITWLSKIQYLHYTTDKDIWSKYKNGELKIKFTSEEGKERYYLFMNSIP
jgi:hypothetical protein